MYIYFFFAWTPNCQGEVSEEIEWEYYGWWVILNFRASFRPDGPNYVNYKKTVYISLSSLFSSKFYTFIAKRQNVGNAILFFGSHSSNYISNASTIASKYIWCYKYQLLISLRNWYKELVEKNSFYNNIVEFGFFSAL